MNTKNKLLFPFDFDRELVKKLNKKWWHRLLLILYYFIAICALVAPFAITLYWICDNWNQADFLILTNLIILSFWVIVCYLFLLLIQILYFYFLDLVYYIAKGERNIFHRTESNNSEIFLKMFLKSLSILLIVNGFSILIALLFAGTNLDLNYYPQLRMK
ncbi:MAG: hypothetical protein PHQ01_02880 [Candidatus Pacebacteria bacterium]|nr:hypothetical protein [Candidatus Paceibacterota bacterium]